MSKVSAVASQHTLACALSGRENVVSSLRWLAVGRSCDDPSMARCVCAVLTLYGNQLMDEGGTALGRMLITNRTLTKLDLDDAGMFLLWRFLYASLKK